MPTPPRFAALFDMDGTLVDSDPLWDAAHEMAASRLRIQFTDDLRAKLVGTTLDTTARTLITHAGYDLLPEYIADVKGLILRSVTAQFAAPLPWRPGARELLTEVRAAKIPTALVTSTESHLVSLALRTLGEFDTIVPGDGVAGQTKPHPMPYKLAAFRLDLAPRFCAAFEDSGPGAESALRAGCMTFVIPHRSPVRRVSGLHFLTSLVGFDVAKLTAHFTERKESHAMAETPIFDALTRERQEPG
jgi:HAD superfamily hydrolase (TIGR01509 family)